jgi:DNA-binding CsgD family transcriptional regulator
MERLLKVAELFTARELASIMAVLELSAQQGEMVRLLMEGASDKQIARRMDIGLPTVRTYMGRVFRKIGVRDRHEVVVRVFREFRGDCVRNRCPKLFNDIGSIGLQK